MPPRGLLPLGPYTDDRLFHGEKNIGPADPMILDSVVFIHQGQQIGLDDILGFAQTQEMLMAGPIFFKGSMLLQNEHWLSTLGWNMLKKDLEQQDRRSYSEEHFSRKFHAGIKIFVIGRLHAQPQFLNSDHVENGLRFQARTPEVAEISGYKKDKWTRWYEVASLHLSTYKNSRKFLEKYHIQKFILDACKSDDAPPLKKDRTMNWLVDTYLDFWDSAAEEKKGRRPCRCDVFNFFARHCEDILVNWIAHSSPLSHQVWKAFCEDVKTSKKMAAREKSSWGEIPRPDWIPEEENQEDQDDDDTMSVELPEHPAHTYIPSYTSSHHASPSPPPRTPSPAQSPDPDPGPGPARSSSPTVAYNPRAHSINPLDVLPKTFWEAPTVPDCFVWRCLIVYPDTNERCHYLVHLLKPTQKDLGYLAKEDQAFLQSKRWRLDDERLAEVFATLTSGHYREHMAEFGVAAERDARGRVSFKWLEQRGRDLRADDAMEVD
ncbi:hypothetical protein SISNIDRAFT_491531 [Sistotremastrum niveocremeum HHB9708]|uniref:Uncharacterized protein n=1 Tax=Sistotremastrum niveocremeum HHB9708 TaxID=1314777 RepID=A0A164MPN2_9AGAM|nr:hypothetical protein SISNIDRAFT_491531 [Sistotremastrum niveocremeum HHB9708]